MVSFSAWLASIRNRCDEWGLRRSLYWYLMNRLAKLGIRLHYVRVGSDMRGILGEEMPDVPVGYETRVVGLAKLLPFVDVVQDLDREFLEAAFARGDTCTANFYNGDLVGYSFSTRARARATKQLDVLVPEGFRYGYKSWTHADHRRHQLARMRGFVRRRDLKPPHEERSISYIETHNYPSLLHSYRHPRERSLAMGFCGWLTLFGRQFPYNSRHAKWVGFEMVRKGDDGQRQYVR